MITHTSFRLLPLFTATLFAGLSATHAQNVIVNGDFEQTPNADSSTTTFPGWGEFENSQNTVQKNAAVVHSGLSGNTAARIPGMTPLPGTPPTTIPGGLRQDVVGPAVFWRLDLDFAMADPGDNGGANTTTERGLNINLFHDVTNNRNINLSVFDDDGNGFGEVRVVTGSATFVKVMTDAVPFSIDSDSNGILSDANDEVKLVHLTIIGTYDSTPSYSIKISHSGGEMTTGELTSWQNNAPAAGFDNIDRINFAGNNVGTQSYVIDNVSLAVPEPGSAALLLLGAVGVGATRRRRS